MTKAVLDFIVKDVFAWGFFMIVLSVLCLWLLDVLSASVGLTTKDFYKFAGFYWMATIVAGAADRINMRLWTWSWK